MPRRPSQHNPERTPGHCPTSRGGGSGGAPGLEPLLSESPPYEPSAGRARGAIRVRFAATSRQRRGVHRAGLRGGPGRRAIGCGGRHAAHAVRGATAERASGIRLWAADPLSQNAGGSADGRFALNLCCNGKPLQAELYTASVA